MKHKWLENFNWPLCGVMLCLILIGLMNLYSAVSLWGEESRIFLFWHQVGWFCIGFVALFLFYIFDYRLWDKLGFYFYGGAVLLLIAVLIFGKNISGHQSWLAIGPLTLQPSEFAKLGLVIALSKFFADNPTLWGFGFMELLKPLALTLFPFTLVLLQKDLGSSLFFLLLFMSLVFVAKIRRKTLLIFIVLFVVGGGVAYQYGLKPYQKERLRVFLNPESDPKRSGYHLIQSKIAVGSGKFLGKGYLNGEINKLRYLPDKHTDFIFPVLAEEWGFLGSVTVMFLFGGLLTMGTVIAMKAREPFGSFLATGLTALLFWHLVINLCGVLGLMPLTGVPLPFFSYGGSSTLTFMIAMGLLLNIHLRRFLF